MTNDREQMTSKFSLRPSAISARMKIRPAERPTRRDDRRAPIPRPENGPMSRPIIRLNRPGFTMVELLVVIVVIALLLALLLPAINGAVRSARNAAVSAEINQLSQALADFKSKYGDYPPSRIMLCENGIWPTASTVNVTTNASEADINLGQLAQ